jgi:RNA polymerase sigma-70 factor (ECF subfamily)
MEPQGSDGTAAITDAWGGAREIDFERIVAEHASSVLRIARRMMRSEDLAWDVVQESLLSLWQAPCFPQEPRAWLARTAKNRCLHLHRTIRRRHRYEEQARAGTSITAPADDRPDHRMEKNHLGRALGRAVAALPPERRAVFVLREIHGLDYPAIARHLGMAVGTVRSRLHRARVELRVALDGHVFEAAAPVAPVHATGHRRIGRLLGPCCLRRRISRSEHEPERREQHALAREQQ